MIISSSQHKFNKDAFLDLCRSYIFRKINERDSDAVARMNKLLQSWSAATYWVKEKKLLIFLVEPEIETFLKKPDQHWARWGHDNNYPQCLIDC